MKTKPALIEVNSPDEVPVFKTRDAERRFWETHSVGPKFPVTRPGISALEMAVSMGALERPKKRKRVA
jgi:hypothetical protein